MICATEEVVREFINTLGVSKMICPDCQKGMVKTIVPKSRGAQIKWLPCPRCQGSGIAYCCDGEDWTAGNSCQARDLD